MYCSVVVEWADTIPDRSLVISLYVSRIFVL